MQLKKKQKFIRALRKLEQSRKMHSIVKSGPQEGYSDPIVDSIRRQLEKDHQPYFDPDNPSVFITYVNGEISKSIEPSIQKKWETARVQNLRQYLDSLHDQFYFCDEYETLKSSSLNGDGFDHLNEIQKFRPHSNAITSTKASTSHNFRPKLISSVIKSRTDRRISTRNGTEQYLIKKNFIKPQNLRKIASSGRL